MRRDIIQAITRPAGRAIITLIALLAMTTNCIAANFNPKRLTVSKHLHILAKCDLVKQEQKGWKIFYSPEKDRMKAIVNWLGQYRNFGKNDLINQTICYQLLK